MPATARVSSFSSTWSSSGTSVRVPSDSTMPAGITISKSFTASKSTAPASPLPLTETVTVVATVRALASSSAVTFTATSPAPSETRAGSTDSTMREDASSLLPSVNEAAVTSRSDSPSTVKVSSRSYV